MGSWRLLLTCRPGHSCPLDEYDRTWDCSTEAALDIARKATAVLRKRYRAANPLCLATQWDGSISDPFRPRREIAHTMNRKESNLSNNLGVIAYFRGSNVWCPPAVLKAALASREIEAYVIDPAARPLERAQAAARNFRGGAGVKADTVHRTDDTISISILVREKVTEKELRWRQVELVEYNTASGWSTPITDHGRAFVECGKLWQSQVDYYAIRKLVFDQLRRIGAFGLGGGGVQYVHADIMPKFRVLQEAIREAVANATLYGIRLDSSDGDTMGAVGDAALTSMTEAVEGVLSDLGAWREKANGRKTSLDRMLAELGTIRGRAAELARALRFNTAELEDAMNEAVAEIQNAIEEMDNGATDEPAAVQQDLPAVPAAPPPPVVEEKTPVVEPPAPAPVPAKPARKRRETVQERRDRESMEAEMAEQEDDGLTDIGRKALAEPPAPKIEPEVHEAAALPNTPAAPEEQDGLDEEPVAPYMPTPDELGKGKLMQVQAWAQGLGIELRADGKNKSRATLASEIAAKRESQSRKTA